MSGIIKTYKPYTPSRRFLTNISSKDITSKPTVKSLLVKLKAHAGRNSGGRITSRHRQAGAKKFYRVIDFRRNKFDVQGKIATIEYDPYRNCRIALVHYEDGDKRYILHSSDLKIGTEIVSSKSNVEISTGNATVLSNIPIGTLVHNVELKPGKGGQLIRSAGAYAQIMGRESKYVSLRFPSGEMRYILASCMATIGVVGNEQFINITVGKAGRSRHLGIRPQTRGSAMNPVDHPHGGGEGKCNGHRHPVSPWGQKAKGLKTRKKTKQSNIYIINERKRGKR